MKKYSIEMLDFYNLSCYTNKTEQDVQLLVLLQLTKERQLWMKKTLPFWHFRKKK